MNIESTIGEENISILSSNYSPVRSESLKIKKLKEKGILDSGKYFIDNIFSTEKAFLLEIV